MRADPLPTNSTEVWAACLIHPWQAQSFPPEARGGLLATLEAHTDVCIQGPAPCTL